MANPKTDEEVMEKALKAYEIAQARNRRHNDYLKENYKRITVTIPKEWESGLKAATKARHETVNSFFKRLLKEELARQGIEVEDIEE